MRVRGARTLFALPRVAFGTARRVGRSVLGAVHGVPRVAEALTDLRNGMRQLERLAGFATQELPEIVYQLERIREQLAAIEKGLAVRGLDEREPVSPGSPRTG